MAIGPVKGITTPLPKFAPGGHAATTVIKVRGVASPLPKFGPPSGTWPNPIHMIPIKPLPTGGGSGGGGSTGYPI